MHDLKGYSMIQIHVLPESYRAVTSLSQISLKSIKFLGSLNQVWIAGIKEQKKRTLKSHLATYTVYGKSRQSSFCPSVNSKEHNLKEKSNGLYSEVSDKLNWQSASVTEYWEATNRPDDKLCPPQEDTLAVF